MQKMSCNFYNNMDNSYIAKYASLESVIIFDKNAQ